MATADLRKGYLLGLVTFGIWGMFPLYFKSIERFAALEIVTQRAIWSALFGTLVLLLWRHPGWLRELLEHPRRIGVLAISSLLIATNWLIYVWAVNHGHMVEASLGYYINPLVNVLLGLVILRERLRPLQWVAVGLAATGVCLQLLRLGEFPWVSMALALSFGTYGLLRKQRRWRRCRGWWSRPGCYCRWRSAGCCCSAAGRAPSRPSGPRPKRSG